MLTHLAGQCNVRQSNSILLLLVAPSEASTLASHTAMSHLSIQISE
jgi:hypothetical protein